MQIVVKIIHRWPRWRRSISRTIVNIERNVCKSLLRRRPRAVAVAALDVIDHQLLEIGGERRAAQRCSFLAVDEDWRGRLLAGAGERDADVGVLGFAGAVEDGAPRRAVMAFA